MSSIDLSSSLPIHVAISDADRHADTQIVDVKKKIQSSQTFPVENQKLIYSGKLCHARRSLPNIL